MFSKDRFQHMITAAVGALIFSAASIGAAVGPAQPLNFAAAAQLASSADLAQA